MEEINFYVIGGQYHRYCYGGTKTLTAAKQLAAKHDEFWDNFGGWHRPRIYAASDCVLAETQFYGEQMVPAPYRLPVAEYDMTGRKWKKVENDLF